jgi:hypothetical protein
VIAVDQDGGPAFTVMDYGKGKIYFLAFPIELDASCKAGVTDGAYAVPYYRFYEQLGIRGADKKAVSGSPYICVTEHIVRDDERLLTVLNHLPEDGKAEIYLEEDWVFDRLITYHGGSAAATEDGFAVNLPHNTGAVAVIKRK